MSGNATLNLTLSDTPPAGVGVISFTLPISGISLVPTTGSAVSVYSGGNFELTRLQSDSAAVAVGVSVPEGSYTAIKVTLGTSSGLFINASGGSITSLAGTCAANAVCPLPAGAATSITFTFPSALTLSSNQKQWIGLDFNLNNAITTANGITVDFGQANVLTATTTAPLGITSGNVANIDDFSGLVTASASNSITVKSGTRGTLTAAITSSTTFNDPQNLCTGSSSVASCISANGKIVVSVQAALSTAGAINATEIDVLDTSGTDSIEGVIFPSTCNGGSNIGMILADSAVPSSNATLTGLSYGAGLCLTVSPTATFFVDTGFLPTGQLTAGFSGPNDILIGQVVRADVSNVVAGSVVDATATNLLLRYSRLSGTVNVVTGNNFTINGLPTYLGFTLSPLVATYAGSTIFEGTTQGISGLSNPLPVAIRALYLNPTTAQQGIPFLATKVRLN
ncbi:MAG: DUF4382 domain-containing protein [Candidatus Acidiferrum sp.]